jgi:hypothetical protein
VSEQPDHGVEPVEADQDVAPRPEEEVADAGRDDPGIPLE